MNRSMANRRMKRELQILSRSPPPGIAAWPREEGSRLDILEAEIRGADETPYQGGVFRLEVSIPSEYPLKPPQVRFLTRIYHPNIDNQGRICMDSLNMPPKGAWKPSLNVATVLTSIQALMGCPNGDDGLMGDIAEEFRSRPDMFAEKAKAWTKRYASGKHVSEQNDIKDPVKDNKQQPSKPEEDSKDDNEKRTEEVGEEESSDDIIEVKQTEKRPPVQPIVSRLRKRSRRS